MKKISQYLPFAGAGVGILIALTPFGLVPVCTKFLELASGALAPMKCHWTGTVEVIIGILIAIISFAGFILERLNHPRSKILGFTLMALGVTGILIPLDGVIGICANPMMACHATVRVINPLLIITIGIGGALFFTKSNEGT